MPRAVLGMIALGLALFTGCGGGAVKAPHNGVWKVTALPPGEEVTVAIVEVKQKVGETAARLLWAGAPEFQQAKVEAAHEDGALRLTLTSEDGSLTFVVRPPEGEAKPQTLLGYVRRPGEREFARLERTEERRLDPKKATKTDPDRDAFNRVARKPDPKEREAGLAGLADRHPADALGYVAGLGLTGTMASNGADEAAVRARAERVVTLASAYGPEMRARALTQVAQTLLASAKAPAAAASYARQADEALGTSAPPAEQVPVVKALAAALRAGGRDEEAKAAAARLDRLEEELDREYRKNAVPFPAEKVGGDGDRVVLVELFTNAQCGPCIPGDVAYDALAQGRDGRDVALLQYHLISAGPDALISRAGDARAEFYNPGGTPTLYVDGRDGPACGGPPEYAKGVSSRLLRAVRERRLQGAEAKLKLAVRRDGDRVTAGVAVTDLKRTGEPIRLRVALVEETVRYAGRNGRRLHHNVLRGFLGEPSGVPLTTASATPEVSASLAEVRRALEEYLEKRPVPKDDRPLTLAHLKVVAFVQDDRTREVLQAAEAAVPGP